VRSGDRTQTRLVRAGSNYASQDPALSYFGLGTAQRVDELRVRWPDGSETTRVDLPAGRELTVEQPPAKVAEGRMPGCGFAP